MMDDINKTNKVLAIIGGGVTAGDYCDACRRIGYESHYFSMADGRLDDGVADAFHEVNIFDKDRIVEICREIGADGVVPTTELTVSIAAYVADKLGLPGNPPDVAAVITDKYRNRRCIAGLDTLLSPRFMTAVSPDDVVKAGMTFPLILKPKGLGGKRGLSVVADETGLEAAFSYARSATSTANSTPPSYLVEEFLDGGVECSVESISSRGKHTIIQITQKDSGGAPHCVELGHHQPADISTDDWARVVRGVSDGLTAIGLTDGCCHTEVKIIDGKLYLIEFNARPGGEHIAHPLVMLSTGFDFLAGLAKAACGELGAVDVSQFEHRCAGLYYVVKQTAYLKPIFDKCSDYAWCVMKHFVSDELPELVRNDLAHSNYMIYCADDGDPVARMLAQAD